jgi:hypothetical protein
MTTTATAAKTTRNHATARSLRSSHPSSGVILSIASMDSSEPFMIDLQLTGFYANGATKGFVS